MNVFVAYDCDGEVNVDQLVGQNLDEDCRLNYTDNAENFQEILTAIDKDCVLLHERFNDVIGYVIKNRRVAFKKVFSINEANSVMVSTLLAEHK